MTSTALTPTKGLTGLIQSAAPRLTPLLPDGVTIEKLQQVVFFEGQKNPALLDCTPASIVAAVARALRSGLEIGETAYLIPYGKTCTFVADYKGLAQLMIASRVVRAIEWEAVHENDEFEYELGLDARLKHRPAGMKRGPIIGAYVILRLPGNTSTFKYMTAEEIDGIRQRYSKTNKNGPLQDWYACKTVLRQIAKGMPKDKRLAAFYAALDADEREEFSDVPEAEVVPDERPAAVDADGVDLTPDEPEMSDEEIADQDARGELPLRGRK